MLNKSCDISMLATYYKILLFCFSPAEGSRPQRINVRLLYGTLCVCVCVCWCHTTVQYVCEQCGNAYMYALLCMWAYLHLHVCGASFW